MTPTLARLSFIRLISSFLIIKRPHLNKPANHRAVARASARRSFPVVQGTHDNSTDHDRYLRVLCRVAYRRGLHADKLTPCPWGPSRPARQDQLRTKS